MCVNDLFQFCADAVLTFVGPEMGFLWCVCDVSRTGRDRFWALEHEERESERSCEYERVYQTRNE